MVYLNRQCDKSMRGTSTCASFSCQYGTDIVINIPAAGGPIMAAMPWNNKVKPKELVRTSRPKRSTRTTEVNETYTPET